MTMELLGITFPITRNLHLALERSFRVCARIAIPRCQNFLHNLEQQALDCCFSDTQPPFVPTNIFKTVNILTCSFTHSTYKHEH